VAYEPQRDPGLARRVEGLSTASAGVMPDSRPPASETSPSAVGRSGETTDE
jgi:hypothetical protein